MNVKTSKLKTDKEGFNNLVSREELLNIIKQYPLVANNIEYVDYLDFDYWSNNEDTLVFFISTNSNVGFGLDLCEMLQRLSIDEFQYTSTTEYKEGGYIVRLWWD